MREGNMSKLLMLTESAEIPMEQKTGHPVAGMPCG
jgi:hypothetical protein